MKKEKCTIVILTNIMTPYRKFFYDELNEECKKNNIDFRVLLMAETEYGRHWNYNELKTEYSILLEHKTKKIGNIEIHFNRGLEKIYREIKPNIVICGGSYLYPAVWKTIKLKRKYNYEIVEWSESHLNEERNYNSVKLKIREIIRRKVIGSFDIFWCAGKFAKEFVEKYAKNDSKYVFTPNLIDTKKFDSINKYTTEDLLRIKEKYNIDKNKRIMITPARLSAVKGIKEFLNLYNKCDNDNITYLIAGDGELKLEISKIIEEKKMDVRLLGYKNEDEMLDLYAISDGFILPSKSDSNPLTCIEACWCKLPLLVSKHVGNYPEIVKEELNGYVFDYNKTEEAISKINKFINSPKEWMKNAKEISYNVARNIYNPNIVVPKIINETIKIYKERRMKND